MGKSFRDRRKADFDDHQQMDVIVVALADVYITDATIAKLLARDGAQIEHYRQAYEYGEDMVRVVLRPRFGGGYNIETVVTASSPPSRPVSLSSKRSWSANHQQLLVSRKENSLLQSRLKCPKGILACFVFPSLYDTVSY